MQNNGVRWLDTQGNTIHAHGGYMLRAQDWTYWYGENRLEGNYVSCYRSKDLERWEFCGNVLRIDSPTQPIDGEADLSLVRPDGGKVNIERPKVIFCQETGKYVLWAHYENGVNYREARACVATCDRPDGDFIYHGSFSPCGAMSRDCTLFADDDQKTYFLSAANDNADMHVYLLRKDCLRVERQVNTLWKGCSREAPAVFKKDGLYYILTSYCSGWEPNQGKFSIGASMDGPFSELSDFGDATTYDSQPAFVLKLPGAGETRYLYFGDRWCYAGAGLTVESADTLACYCNSTYVVLPIEFDGRRPYIRYADRCE